MAYSEDGSRIMSVGGTDMKFWWSADCIAACLGVCAMGYQWPTGSEGVGAGTSATAVALSRLRAASADSNGIVTVQALDPALQLAAALALVYNSTRISPTDKVRGGIGPLVARRRLMTERGRVFSSGGP